MYLKQWSSVTKNPLQAIEVIWDSTPPEKFHVLQEVGMLCWAQPIMCCKTGFELPYVK